MHASYILRCVGLVKNEWAAFDLMSEKRVHTPGSAQQACSQKSDRLLISRDILNVIKKYLFLQLIYLQWTDQPYASCCPLEQQHQSNYHCIQQRQGSPTGELKMSLLASAPAIFLVQMQQPLPVPPTTLNPASCHPPAEATPPASCFTYPDSSASSNQDWTQCLTSTSPGAINVVYSMLATKIPSWVTLSQSFNQPQGGWENSRRGELNLCKPWAFVLAQERWDINPIN